MPRTWICRNQFAGVTTTIFAAAMCAASSRMKAANIMSRPPNLYLQQAHLHFDVDGQNTIKAE